MNRFFDLYLNAFKNYINFLGRACRAEALAFLIPNILILYALHYVSHINTTLGKVCTVILAIYCFVAVVPSFSLAVRRLHDINQNGWLLMALIIGCWIQNVNIIIGIIFAAAMFFLKGDTGENNYGEPSYMYNQEV